MMIGRLALVALLIQLVACGSSPLALVDAAADQLSVCDATSPQFCVAVFSSPGGGTLCSDEYESAVCEAGHWKCPQGLIDLAGCNCSGPQLPNCSCTSAGPVCPDAGVPDGPPPDSKPETGVPEAPVDAADGVKCRGPIDGGGPFGECPAQFDDPSWKKDFCYDPVIETVCTGYRARHFNFITHSWTCYYDPMTLTLVGGEFRDDIPDFCAGSSSEETLGTVPEAGTCSSSSQPCGIDGGIDIRD
ncbi:MAG TPA: hypothetical protein VGL59_06755 [Polyangia bacterium]